MTENEIINHLKENKNKGIAVGFLPEEVRAWVYITPISLFRVFDGKEWIKSENTFIRDNDIICLPDNYEAKKEQKGEWIEFEIDEGGDFGYLAESEKDERYKSSYYSWYSWQKFLEDSKLNERGFTAFGGWQYNNASDEWYMTPKVDSYNHNCHCYCTQYKGSEKNIIPAIPIKIRFWREIK